MLHIVPAYGIGGVEIAAETAARESEGAVRTHFLAAVEGWPDPAPSCWITQGSKYHTSGIRATLRAIREIRRTDPEIVLFSLWRSLPALLAARIVFPRKKTVTFLHNERDLHWLDKISTWLMIRAAHEIWGDSESALVGRHVDPRTARVISMRLYPAPERAELEAAEPAPNFVSWCRLNAQKRIDRALQLVARLKEKLPGVRYSIIGPDSGTLSQLKTVVERLGLEDNVEFLGPRDRRFIEAAARSATFFLQLSDFEGQSMAVVEAMQLGLVPVVTPVGGIPAYASDGVNAIFVSELAAAAERIERLLADPAEIIRMSDSAREQFSSGGTYTEQILEAASAAAGS